MANSSYSAFNSAFVAGVYHLVADVFIFLFKSHPLTKAFCNISGSTVLLSDKPLQPQAAKSCNLALAKTSRE